MLFRTLLVRKFRSKDIVDLSVTIALCPACGKRNDSAFVSMVKDSHGEGVVDYKVCDHCKRFRLTHSVVIIDKEQYGLRGNVIVDWDEAKKLYPDLRVQKIPDTRVVFKRGCNEKN